MSVLHLQELLVARLAPLGFDLVAPFRTSWYNPYVDSDYKLNDFRRHGAALGFVVGANKHLWDVFLKYLAADPATRAHEEHPLDKYVEQAITQDLVRNVLHNAGFTALSGSSSCSEIRFSHHWNLGDKKVAIQRLAHVSGLAYLNETCHLNIHPIHGPYITLRASIVLDLEVSTEDLEKPVPIDPCPEVAGELRRMMEELQKQAGTTRKFDTTGLIAMRDLAHSGFPKEWRYSEDQLRYHYLKDRDFLRSLLVEK